MVPEGRSCKEQIQIVQIRGEGEGRQSQAHWYNRSHPAHLHFQPFSPSSIDRRIAVICRPGAENVEQISEVAVAAALVSSDPTHR